MKKIDAVVKKVVVCMDDYYFFAVSVVVCEGLQRANHEKVLTLRYNFTLISP